MCTDNAACPEATPICANAGAFNASCVECETDADCATGVCVGNACVACAADGDCDDGDACTTDACTDNACSNTAIVCGADEICTDGDCVAVECETDDDCTGGTLCAPEACTGGLCVDGDDPCPGQICVEDDGSCIDCETDDDCGVDETCDPTTNTCLTLGCATDDDCDAGTLCDVGSGECVACLTNADCADGEVCSGNACEAGTVCATDADCDDDLFCNGEETCGADLLCADGAAPDCGAGTCDEGTQSCLNTGEPFTFTTSIDSLVGTEADDTFTGVAQVTNGTFSAGDSANGGAGIDVLKVFLVDTNLTAGTTVSNVETIQAQNTTATARTFSVTGWTNYDSLTSLSSLGPVTFNGIDTLVDVGLDNNAQNLTAVFDSTALTGTADSVTVNVNKSSTSSGGATVVIDSTNATDGVETIVLNSMGTTANRLGSIDDGGENDFTNLTFTGDQDMRVNAVGTSVKTYDASGAGGKIDVTIGSPTSTTVTGSPQDDTIRATALAAGNTINGGLGNDTLEISGTLGGTLNDVEALSIKSTTTPNVDLTNATSITTLNVDGDTGGGITQFDATLNPASTIAVTSNTNLVFGAGSTLALVGTGSTSTLAFTFAGNGTATVGAAGAADLTITEFTALSFAFNGGAGAFQGAGGTAAFDETGNTLKTITLTGSSTVNMGANLLTDSTVFDTLDGSGLTGMLTTAAANFPGTAMTISGGAGNDSITTGAGASTVNGNAGNDAIVGGAGADVIDGGAGNDVILPAGGANTSTGGAGDDTFLFSGTANYIGTLSDYRSSGADVISGAAADTTAGVAVYTTVAGIANVTAGTIARASAGDTTANIAGAVTTAAAQVNSLLLILDTTKGHAVLVHDADWNTAGGRNVIDILSLTTQAAIDALANGTILTQ